MKLIITRIKSSKWKHPEGALCEKQEDFPIPQFIGLPRQQIFPQHYTVCFESSISRLFYGLWLSRRPCPILRIYITDTGGCDFDIEKRYEMDIWFIGRFYLCWERCTCFQKSQPNQITLTNVKYNLIVVLKIIQGLVFSKFSKHILNGDSKSK